MMLRCRQVVEMVGTDTLPAQPLSVRLGIRLHLAICRYCSAYARGIATVRRLAANSARELLGGDSIRKEQVLAVIMQEARVKRG